MFQRPLSLRILALMRHTHTHDGLMMVHLEQLIPYYSAHSEQPRMRSVVGFVCICGVCVCVCSSIESSDRGNHQRPPLESGEDCFGQ